MFNSLQCFLIFLDRRNCVSKQNKKQRRRSTVSKNDENLLIQSAGISLNDHSQFPNFPFAHNSGRKNLPTPPVGVGSLYCVPCGVKLANRPTERKSCLNHIQRETYSPNSFRDITFLTKQV